MKKLILSFVFVALPLAAAADCTSDYKAIFNRLNPAASTMVQKGRGTHFKLDLGMSDSEYLGTGVYGRLLAGRYVLVNTDLSCRTSQDFKHALIAHEIGHWLARLLDPDIVGNELYDVWDYPTKESYADKRGQKVLDASGVKVDLHKVLRETSLPR